jgi:hypothetical protein
VILATSDRRERVALDGLTLQPLEAIAVRLD